MIDNNQQSTDQNTPKPVRKRGQGFASMPIERRTEIARKGGVAAQATGKAHRFTTEEAQAAGKKGGTISRRGRRGTTSEEIAALHVRIAQQIERGE